MQTIFASTSIYYYYIHPTTGTPALHAQSLLGVDQLLLSKVLTSSRSIKVYKKWNKSSLGEDDQELIPKESAFISNESLHTFFHINTYSSLANVGEFQKLLEYFRKFIRFGTNGVGPTKEVVAVGAPLYIMYWACVDDAF